MSSPTEEKWINALTGIVMTAIVIAVGFLLVGIAVWANHKMRGGC